MHSQAVKPNKQSEQPLVFGKNFEYVGAPAQLLDRVSYRELGPGSTEPIQNAEKMLRFIEPDFANWLRADNLELHSAWVDLKSRPIDPIVFLRFHKAVHVIRGNAAMLNCAIAGQLATPVARLLERTPDIEDHISTIEPAMAAIHMIISGEIKTGDPRLEELRDILETIVNRWITRR